MNIQELTQQPTALGTIHESCFRSYHILRYAEHLLERGTPPDVVLQLIREIQAFPPINDDRPMQAFSVAAALAGV